MSLRLTLFAFACYLPTLAYGDAAFDAAALLGRIATAAQRLSYTGTFVYQSGSHTETSRVTHIFDGRDERERLEVLDGSPREVVRTNEEVRCFLPEQRLLIVERPTVRRGFPGRLLPASNAIVDYYEIRRGDVSRIADRESQLLILEPKDSLRYGHMLWADVSSGLLLKARMVNQRHEQIEQFYFTSVQIGGTIDKELVKPKAARKVADWRVHDAKTVDADIGKSEWSFKVQPPGFKQSAGMRRQLKPGAPDVMHVVFSDGLAAMSVFIEPLSALSEPPRQGIFSTGAINVYKRVEGDYLLTILGEVPPQTLKMLGDGVEARLTR